MRNITKEQIVNDLLANGFTLDGTTDYRRVNEFVKAEFMVRLSNKSTWAVINAIKTEGIEELDFD